MLYAVYEFLERYAGCRWYSPEMEKIPEQKIVAIQLPLSYSYTPEITTRTVHSRLFYDHPAFADKMRVTHKTFPGYVPVAAVHTFNRFLPAKNFFKTHPEYYGIS